MASSVTSLSPQDALMQMDNIVQQAGLTRQQHAHLVHCRMTVLAALNELADIKKSRPGEQDGDKPPTE